MRADRLAWVAAYRREMKGEGLLTPTPPVEQSSPTTTEAVLGEPGEQRLPTDNRMIGSTDRGERVSNTEPVGSSLVSGSRHG